MPSLSKMKLGLINCEVFIMRILILLFTLLCTFAAYAAGEPWNQELPFKEAVIEYKVEGMMKGSKTIYIKDYGRESAEYVNTSMSMMGMQHKQQEVVITAPEWVYSFDLINKQGSKQINPNKVFEEEFAKLSKSEQQKVMDNAEKSGLNSIAGMHGKVQKKAVKLLGYQCDIAELMGTTVYTIANTELPLKVVSKTMGANYSETATAINVGKVAEDKFKHPSGIRLSHDKQADEMIRYQVKNTIKQLRSGTVTGSPNQGGALQQPGGSPDSDVTNEQMQQLQKMMQMIGGGQ